MNEVNFDGLKGTYTDKRGNTYELICATKVHAFLRGDNHGRITRFMVERDPDTGAIEDHLPRVLKYHEDTDAKMWMFRQADHFPENYIYDEVLARVDAAKDALTDFPND